MTSSEQPTPDEPTMEAMRASLRHAATKARQLAEENRAMALTRDAGFSAANAEAWSKVAADLRELDARLPELVADSERLADVRAFCRVVFYPPEVGAYPIEHAPLARKDSWGAIMRAIDAARVSHAGSTTTRVAANGCNRTASAAEPSPPRARESDGVAATFRAAIANLERFAAHGAECFASTGAPRECRCGLSDALEQAYDAAGAAAGSTTTREEGENA